MAYDDREDRTPGDAQRTPPDTRSATSLVQGYKRAFQEPAGNVLQ